MALIVKVVSYKGSPPAQAISAQFDEQGGSIGRSPDNHLVLPDPEKFISRLHARIIFQGGQYFIQDSSTGGTYLGPNQQFLHQSQAALANGERLRIGEYELMVSAGANAQADLVPSLEPVRQLELAESGLLENPFAEPEKPVAGDFFKSFIDQPESAVFHESFTPPQVADSPQTSGDDDLDFGDLLSSLEALPGSGGFHKPEPPPLDLPPLPDDFFADELVAPPIPAEPVADLRDLANERGIQPPQEFADLFESPAPPVATESSIDSFAASEKPLPAVEETRSTFERPRTGEPTESPLDPFAAIDKPLPPTEEAPGAFQMPRPAVGPVKSAVVGETPVSVHQPAPVEQAPEPRLAAVADSELFRQFLAGVGITDASIVPAEQWPALMKTSGELLRSMVEGLMLVLRARAELKSQFRVSVTTMRPVNNNPLKFTPNVDDAVKLILAPTHPGFLGPKEAVREGFSDIMNHQMAMTAGIQAALSEVLRSFDPERVETSQTEGVLFQKKAKCWEHYVASYPQLKAVAQEEFFGEAFAEAYEKQMRLLSSASKPQ